MSEEGRLGIPVPELRAIAKNLGKDHQLALELWKTRIAEARILASMVAEPDRLTEEEMGELGGRFRIPGMYATRCA